MLKENLKLNLKDPILPSMYANLNIHCIIIIFCIEYCTVLTSFEGLISFSMECTVSYTEHFISYLKNKIIGRNPTATI